MKTLVRHLGCGEPIYVVDRELVPGTLIVASEWHSLNPAWPDPRGGEGGEVATCPNCHELISFDERCLQIVTVDEW